MGAHSYSGPFTGFSDQSEWAEDFFDFMKLNR